MGYIFLFLSLFAGLTKAYCGKKTSGHLTGYQEAMLANILRMFLCTLIGLALVLITEGTHFLLLDTDTLLLSIFSGITTAMFVVLWLICVKTGAYMMIEVFIMLGVTIPLLMGIPFFHESVTIIQWLGIALLCIASFVLCSYNNTIKQKLTLKALVLLVLCGMSSGLTDFLQKLFISTQHHVPISVFNLYTYLFSLLFLIFVFCCTTKKTVTDKEIIGSKLKKIGGYILVMSVCLFASSFFKTYAAVYLDSVQLYPVSQGLALILSSFMSAVFFKEKPTTKSVVGLCLAFVGIIMINFLS